MGRRTTLATAALVALGLVDVALVGLLLRPAHHAAASTIVVTPGAGGSPQAFALPTPTSASPTSSPPESPSPSPTSPAASPTVAPAFGPAVPVDAGSGGFVLLADPGACSATGKPTLQFSATDGATWVRLSLPVGVTQIRRVAIESPSVLWFVGAGPDCSPRLWRSTDAGKSWAGPGSAAGAWYAPTSGPAGAHAPGGTEASLCRGSGVVGLAPAGPLAAALACTDGSVRWTTDAGKSWAPVASLPGVRAIALWTPQRGVALQATATCPGLAVVRTENAGATWAPTACLTGVPRTGPVGVAIAGKSVSVVVSGTGSKTGVWVSLSGATGWSQTAS